VYKEKTLTGKKQRSVGSFLLRKKLGKVILLLGSDNVGERAGAVAAIKRLLAAEGLNLSDLADEVGASPEQTPSDAFIQDAQRPGSQGWTLDEFFVEDEFDFNNLVAGIRTDEVIK
jgi:hypothetical protein